MKWYYFRVQLVFINWNFFTLVHILQRYYFAPICFTNSKCYFNKDQEQNVKTRQYRIWDTFVDNLSIPRLFASKYILLFVVFQFGIIFYNEKKVKTHKTILSCAHVWIYFLNCCALCFIFFQGFNFSEAFTALGTIRLCCENCWRNHRLGPFPWWEYVIRCGVSAALSSCIIFIPSTNAHSIDRSISICVTLLHVH